MSSDVLPSPALSADEPTSDRGSDAFVRVAELGGSERVGQGLGAVGTVLVHVAGLLAVVTSLAEVRSFAEDVQSRVRDRLAATVDIDVPPPEPEPEAPPPEPEAPEPPPPTQAPAPTPAAAPTPDTGEPPPPAPAEAAPILAAPDEPLDLTDQGFVSGTGAAFRGGETSATGTSKTAVRSGAQLGGVPNGTGTAPAPAPVVSKARTASLGAGSSWSCPFPPEADAEQINEAIVRLVVVVSATGKAESVTVVGDPGFGFGREARRCAMSRRYEPALDASGKPITQATPAFRVRFNR